MLERIQYAQRLIRHYKLKGSSRANHDKVLIFGILLFLFFIWGGWNRGKGRNTQLTGSQWEYHRSG